MSPAVSVDDKLAASDPPIFLIQVEKAVRENAWRPLTFYWGFKLTHLFTADNKPRSVYYSYKEYADLANGGRNAKITSSPERRGDRPLERGHRHVPPASGPQPLAPSIRNKCWAT